MAGRKLSITVGIPALNEPLLKRCLKAVLAEPGRKEVIVVSPSPEMAMLVKEFKQVKFIKEPKPRGKPSAVNQILHAAKGDVIVLTDADMVIEKGALKELLKPLKDPNVSVVCGRPVVKRQQGMLGYWGRVLYDIVHQQRLKGATHLTTNLCAFRKGCVKQIPEQSLVDDYIIGLECLKHGEFAYAPQARVRVQFPTTINDFLKQRVRTFAGYMQVKDWYGKSERSLSQEASQAGSVLSYIKNPLHFYWITWLASMRLLAWLGAFYKYKIKHKDIIEIWKPAHSTKK